MELRPFRAIRFSAALIAQTGLENLIAPVPAGKAFAPAAGGQSLKDWLATGRLWKERRPGMWQQRQILGPPDAPVIIRMLVGVVRVDPPGEVQLPAEPPAEGRDGRLARLRELKADFEPALILTRAPLTAALATTRRPDQSVTDAEGVRHDLLRITDYAEHVELQGLVKNAEATLVTGGEDWEAAREMAKDAAAAKMPGARYKLCAIAEESAVGALGRLPRLYAGFWGFALEDPVY